MIRQDVVINNYKYIVDVYKAETADLIENRYAEFVMLRNYEFSNNIVNDKDVYIIEKSVSMGRFELPEAVFVYLHV